MNIPMHHPIHLPSGFMDVQLFTGNRRLDIVALSIAEPSQLDLLVSLSQTRRTESVVKSSALHVVETLTYAMF